MVYVRLYKMTKSAMQSGQAKSSWVLEFEQTRARYIEPLRGWIGTQDTRTQVSLKFPSQQAGEAFAKDHELIYTLEEPSISKIVPKSYATNFQLPKIS